MMPRPKQVVVYCLFIKYLMQCVVRVHPLSCHPPHYRHNLRACKGSLQRHSTKRWLRGSSASFSSVSSSSSSSVCNGGGDDVFRITHENLLTGHVGRITLTSLPSLHRSTANPAAVSGVHAIRQENRNRTVFGCIRQCTITE